MIRKLKLQKRSVQLSLLMLICLLALLGNSIFAESSETLPLPGENNGQVENSSQTENSVQENTYQAEKAMETTDWLSLKEKVKLGEKNLSQEAGFETRSDTDDGIPSSDSSSSDESFLN